MSACIISQQLKTFPIQGLTLQRLGKLAHAARAHSRLSSKYKSFFLVPMNYFDYDISIDSTNAILLTPPEDRGDPFTYDNYGVKPAHCVPAAPPPFEYYGMTIHDQDGNLAPASMEGMNRMTETYHRIQVEL